MRSTRTLFTLLLPAAVVLISMQIVTAQRLARASNFVRDASVAPAAEVGGIKEVIPEKYARRYEEWKTEFLSTDIGKAQWEMYAHHPRLQLTITIGGKSMQGAGTGKYKWNDAGELVSATIMLGERIDEGYPSAVYYPVMNALEPFESRQLIGGSVLAATCAAICGQSIHRNIGHRAVPSSLAASVNSGSTVRNACVTVFQPTAE